MKLFTALAALTLISAPVQAGEAWARFAGKQACQSMRSGVHADVAFNNAMKAVLANPTYKQEFVQFAASKGQGAQINAEGALYRGFYAACPEHNPMNLLR